MGRDPPDGRLQPLRRLRPFEEVPGQASYILPRHTARSNSDLSKMPLDFETEKEAKDAFIIFDEAYEGNDVDAFYLADILRAVGCNVTNAKAKEHGKTDQLGEKRITYADFVPILEAAKADLSATGCKEDYEEGLKVFDKEGTGKIPLAEVTNALASLGEKLEAEEAEKLIKILNINEDEEGFISYNEFITSLLSKCP